MVILMALLACEPHKIRQLTEIDGDWSGTYQIGEGEDEWSEIQVDFDVNAPENECALIFSAPETEPAYSITYACDIYLAERGFLRMPNCTATISIYDEDDKIGDQVREAYDEVRFSRVERSGDTLFLGDYILSR